MNRAVQPQKMARIKLEISDLGRRDCTICLTKTKALISFAVTAKLICVFVFAYAKSRFSHDEAHISGIFLVSSGAEFRPLPQWDFGDFFPNLKKIPISNKKKKIFCVEFLFSHHIHTQATW